AYKHGPPAEALPVPSRLAPDMKAKNRLSELAPLPKADQMLAEKAKTPLSELAPLPKADQMLAEKASHHEPVQPLLGALAGKVKILSRPPDTKLAEKPPPTEAQGQQEAGQQKLAGGAGSKPLLAEAANITEKLLSASTTAIPGASVIPEYTQESRSTAVLRPLKVLQRTRDADGAAGATSIPLPSAPLGGRLKECSRSVDVVIEGLLSDWQTQELVV
ncbi:unnamed protein product, partial [Polarella glacialis]